jgi:hypothetical protein
MKKKKEIEDMHWRYVKIYDEEPSEYVLGILYALDWVLDIKEDE